MYSLRQITPPEFEPLSLTEAKKHLRVDVNDDDALIWEYLKAARRELENKNSLAFMTQTWELLLDDFPCDGESIIIADKRPLQSVTSIKYIDIAGVEQTLSSAKYTVHKSGIEGEIALAYNEVWPSVRCQRNAVTVRFVAGYSSDAEDIPDHCKQALRLVLGHYYENREDTIVGTAMNHIPAGAAALMASEKLWGV